MNNDEPRAQLDDEIAYLSSYSVKWIYRIVVWGILIHIALTIAGGWLMWYFIDKAQDEAFFIHNEYLKK
jgi:hypothetical protein